MRKPRCYVAGPMRRREHFNFPAFDQAAYKLRDLGWDVVSPAELDRYFENWELYPPEDLEVTHELKVRCMRRDLATLFEFDPTKGDAIYRLPGWETSDGTLVELRLAMFLGLRVLDRIVLP